MKTKHSILQVGFFPEAMNSEVNQRFNSTYIINAEKHLPHHKFEILLTTGTTVLTTDFLDSLPHLKMVSSCAVGYDNLPLSYFKSRKIVATHTPSVLNQAVCELTMGILFGMLRRLPQANQFAKSGQWSSGGFPLGTSLAGKTVGIVGMGRIAQDLSKCLLPLGVKLAYTTPNKKELPYTYHNNITSLAHAADILIMMCPGGPVTEKIANLEVFEALGPQGYFINVARGSVVNEIDLIEALKNKVISAAALDVYPKEPSINPDLFDIDNLYLTPHLGSSTFETKQAMIALSLNNIDAFIHQTPLITPILF